MKNGVLDTIRKRRNMAQRLKIKHRGRTPYNMPESTKNKIRDSVNARIKYKKQLRAELCP